MEELFEVGEKAYNEAGYKGEWGNHIQSGISRYNPLESLVNAIDDTKININNIMAFNPTIKGAKSEDPILIKELNNETMVYDSRWPYEEINICDKKFKRPVIMGI